MRHVLAIILFPINWIALFIVRVFYYDIVWGIINLLINICYGFFNFLIYLLILPFWLIIDTILAIIFTSRDSFLLSRSIVKKDKPVSYYFKMQNHSLQRKKEEYTNSNGNYYIKRERDKKEHYTNEK